MIMPYEALSKIFNAIKPLNKEKISIFESDKRVAADAVYSKRSLPVYDNSAMDGYALKYEDIKNAPAKLYVKGTIKAGDSIDSLNIEKGECFRIMTGAFIPQGADTVIEFELTNQTDNTVEILKSKKIGSNIRKAGEDIIAGAKINFSGKEMTPYRISRLVSTGNIFLSVYKKPHIAIIATGDELEYPGECGIVNTIDSNSFFVKSFLKNLGIEADYLGIAKDKKEDLIELINQGKNYDIIITSAGISFGDFDIVTNVEKEVGIEWIFKNVKQKPGKPFAFGRIDNSFIFSFPGNPVSSAFCSYFYLMPAVKKMMGYKNYQNKPINAELTDSIKKSNDRVHFNRVKVETKNNRFYAEPFATQGSNIIESLIHCNGFAMIDSNIVGKVEKGTKCKVFMYDFSSMLSY